MQGAEIYALGILTGILLIALLYKKLDSLRRSRIVKKAKKAEQEAIQLLEKNGYKIIASQQSVKTYTQVDGETIENRVVADYIAKKKGKSYVVEVKTGKQIVKVTTSHIRRQLLEYYLIFQPHGIILLDMDNKKLMKVTFNHLGDNSLRMQWLRKSLAVIGILSIGFFMGYIWNLHR